MLASVAFLFFYSVRGVGARSNAELRTGGVRPALLYDEVLPVDPRHFGFLPCVVRHDFGQRQFRNRICAYCRRPGIHHGCHVAEEVGSCRDSSPSTPR